MNEMLKDHHLKRGRQRTANKAVDNISKKIKEKECMKKLIISSLIEMMDYSGVSENLRIDDYKLVRDDVSRARISGEILREMLKKGMEKQDCEALADALAIDDALSVDPFDMEIAEEDDDEHAWYSLYWFNTMYYRSTIDLQKLMRNASTSSVRKRILAEYIKTSIYQLMPIGNPIGEPEPDRNDPICVYVEIHEDGAEICPDFSEVIEFAPEKKSVNERALMRILEVAMETPAAGTERYILLSKKYSGYEEQAVKAGVTVLRTENDLYEVINRAAEENSMERVQVKRVVDDEAEIYLDIYADNGPKIGRLDIKKDDSGAFFIRRFDIEPKWRRNGIGRYAMNIACENLKLKGVAKIMVDPAPVGWDGKSDRATLTSVLREIYEHLGFCPCSDSVEGRMYREL